MSLVSEELAIGGRHLRNRFVMAPVKTGYGTKTGEVTDRHLHFYHRRNHFLGAITPEPFYLHPSLRELPVQIGIHNDEMIPGLRRLAGVIHENGALAIVHLNHPGRMANPNIPGNQYLSSSEQTCATGGKQPVAMNEESITDAELLFQKAAVRAQEAGYDFIELQFGHGYLIAQFLSENVNNRTDRYGGSWENRLRFGLEVLERVKRAVSIPTIIRLSADEMTPGGLKLEDTIRLSTALKQKGADAIHVSSGSVCETPPWYFQHMSIPKGKTWEFASKIRSKVNIPVIAVGQINEKNDPEKILGDRLADAVAIGRPLVADPDFAGKVLGEIKDPIRPCACCLEGCIGGIRSGKGLMCVVNPEVGKEEKPLAKVAKVKKVAVVGGGPAGMEAALVLNERGHRVTLFEKKKLGGMFDLAYRAPRKANLEKLEIYLVNLVKDKINVAYREADPDELIGNYDTVILATGSHPKTPTIPGLTEWHWAEILEPDKIPKNKKGVIVGGGFIGAEIAEVLVKNGNDVTIIKKSEEIAPRMEVMSRNFLLKALKELKVKILTGADVVRKKGETLYLSIGDKEGRIENVGFVVYTKGMVPENSMENRLKGKIEVFLVGDCKEIGRAMDAIHSAYGCAVSV
ncbi:MAG: FAD-dependent oxidoreductase [Deltaproteobacteria bacterium]|nr:FAD-dependent oxidoreductase [Deltaproteobacteria bacterium]